MPETARYTVAEEIANSTTHAAGLLLSITGLMLLIERAGAYGDFRYGVSVGVFGLSLILLYGASTAYHVTGHARAKSLLQVIDHAAIYVLIAGTYTPFMLVSLRGPWGSSMLAVVWSLALVGIAVEVWSKRPRRRVTVGLSIAMGWCVVVVIEPMLRLVPTGALLLLLIGGIFYTTGVGFYLWRGLRHHHAIWHLFVLAGSVAHYFAVLLYVIP